MLLARRGYRVLLVDRAAFPSDTISTLYIQQSGVARLEQWGLLDEVRRSNCPPIRRWIWDFGVETLAGFPPSPDGVEAAFAPRRTVLDKILVDAAARSGAEVRERFTVREIEQDGEQVTGIRGELADGSTVRERARIVIGADGMRSLVARTVAAPSYGEKASLNCWYYTFFSGVPCEALELYARDKHGMSASPTNDGLTLVNVGWGREHFAEYKADLERSWFRVLELAPALAERVSRGKREERFVGSADVPTFFRRPFGPGWALVGDAGYHKDPVTALGISDAFRDAELLARAIDDGFAGRMPLEDALSRYERARNEAAAPLCEWTSRLAELRPISPRAARLFAALKRDQVETNRYFGLMSGSVRPDQFFDPANIERLLARLDDGGEQRVSE
jgi:2-polyprenyl-6-methoxyphenol hydroxylase-like FAD-dependent oxidoreductase